MGFYLVVLFVTHGAYYNLVFVSISLAVLSSVDVQVSVTNFLDFPC